MNNENNFVIIGCRATNDLDEYMICDLDCPYNHEDKKCVDFGKSANATYLRVI